VPLSLTDLAAGHVFEPIVLTIDAARARAYLDAIGDTNPFYEKEGLVPPLALAALTLGGLLNQVGLPPGSLHVNETVESRHAVAIGATVECRATLAQRSQRAGWVVSVLDSQITLDGELALSARATVMSPGAPA
jgi:hypothetical protein